MVFLSNIMNKIPKKFSHILKFDLIENMPKYASCPWIDLSVLYNILFIIG